LAIQLRSDQVCNLRKKLNENVGALVTIDLPDQIVSAPDGARYTFEIDHFVKRLILEGLDEIALTLGLSEKIAAFSARQRDLLPWVFDTH
jgi:3-isopropylmalate/(R)-2-methylmalate dehydratase small subunit